MTVFFNTEIKADSFTENLGNFCFIPVRALFDGKTYTKVDEVFLERQSLESSSVIGKVIKVALSIIFLIPGVILGTVIKGCSFISHSVRNSNNLFNKAKTVNDSPRSIIEGDTMQINLLGDPHKFDPSVDSFKKGLPYDWIEDNISSPKKMNLSGFRPHVVERLFKMHLNFHSVDELDLSNTQLVGEQVRKVVERCPNVRKLELEGLHFDQETAEHIRGNCQTLDTSSLAQVQKAASGEV